MQFTAKGVSHIKIAYIGGGSREWARKLMCDLALEKSLGGTVALYDIDIAAAEENAIIGNMVTKENPGSADWKYISCSNLRQACEGADFVIISILPGDFDAMEYDVTLPKSYGINQPVGDSTDIGGVVRGLRTVHMHREIAFAVKEYCPTAFVINYTNPMAISVKALYTAFPQIQAVGCCHEVFGVQKIFVEALRELKNIKADFKDINIEVNGINHFTWITRAFYKNIDLMPLYREFSEKYADGFTFGMDINKLNYVDDSAQLVKFDLFKRFGVIAAAGDRHLAEFCPVNWYLKTPELTESFKFGLTDISWRKNRREAQLKKTRRLLRGEEVLKIEPSGEAGVEMIKALCGLAVMKTNVNTVNRGQSPQLPLGTVVETNALLSGMGVEPIVSATPLPDGALALVERVARLQDMTVKAAVEYDLDLAFQAFIMGPLNHLSIRRSKELFDKMIEGTKKFLPKEYFTQKRG